VANECGAYIGGAGSGLTGGVAQCMNRTTGQSVIAPLDAALAYNCEAAGLLSTHGDSVQLKVTGAAGINTVQGTASGTSSQVARCQNTTTGQSVNIPLGGRDSWNCAQAGLTIAPGNNIVETLIGTAD